MLPTSHPVLMNRDLGHAGDAAQCSGSTGVTLGGGNRELAVHHLASAFSDFINASSQLEDSYRQLQAEVAELRSELSRRNADLQSSLAENNRIRVNLEQVVNSMPCGVLVFDERGIISMANPEGSRLLGLRPVVSEEQPLDLAQVSAATGINLSPLLQRAVEDELIEEVCLHRDFQTRWLEVRIRRFRSIRGCLETDSAESILILRDVTARKRAEQERENGRHALALAEVSREVAHEIRNPLASLELFAELVEQDDAQRATWISHLRAGIRSLSTTVNNVLSLRSGSFKLDLTDLSLAVGEALKFARPLLAQAQLSLHWCATAQDPYVLSSPAAIQQIILNLVTNAIRYTPAGGSIEVSLSREIRKDQGSETEWLVFDFADSGSGIPTEHLPRLFDSGFSGSGTTSGLGLTVCERIMREHGGNIRAQNRSAGGARFTLTFPALRNGAVAA